MPEPPCHHLASLLPLVDSLNEELAGISRGASHGLVPLSYWLNQIEAKAALLEGVPAPLHAAIALARKWLEESGSDEGGQNLPVAHLQFWIGWMRRALHAAVRAEPLPAWPEDFEQRPKSALYRAFALEARGLLEQIEAAVLTWAAEVKDENAGSGVPTLDAPLRSLHTFKGSAALLNLGPVTELAHDLESLLAGVGRQTGSAGPDVLELLLAGTALLGQFVAELNASYTAKGFSPSLLDAAQALRARIHAVAGPAPQTVAPRPSSPGAPEPSATEWVRVEAPRLEALLDLFDRWREAHAAVSHAAWDGRADQRQQFFRSLSCLHELGAEVQAAAEALRRASLRQVFDKLEYLVNGLAPRLGKLARFRPEGQEVEVDAALVTELDAILLHLARNALDHGLESPARRRAAGKPETGTICLSARSYEAAIVVELRDDGAGLDLERILARAVAQGLVAPGASLSANEILDLICLPGFSTVATANELSGRGLGLDVVKRAVERMGGNLELESSPGQGTMFRVYLPRPAPARKPVAAAPVAAVRVATGRGAPAVSDPATEPAGVLRGDRGGAVSGGVSYRPREEGVERTLRRDGGA